MSILEIILLVLLVLVYTGYLALLSLLIEEYKWQGYPIPKKHIVKYVLFPTVILLVVIAKAKRNYKEKQK